MSVSRSKSRSVFTTMPLVSRWLAARKLKRAVGPPVSSAPAAALAAICETRRRAVFLAAPSIVTMCSRSSSEEEEDGAAESGATAAPVAVRVDMVAGTWSCVVGDANQQTRSDDDGEGEDEEAARTALFSIPPTSRQAASSSFRASGENWARASWSARLEACALITPPTYAQHVAAGGRAGPEGSQPVDATARWRGAVRAIVYRPHRKDSCDLAFVDPTIVQHPQRKDSRDLAFVDPVAVGATHAVAARRFPDFNTPTTTTAATTAAAGANPMFPSSGTARRPRARTPQRAPTLEEDEFELIIQRIHRATSAAQRAVGNPAAVLV